MEGVHSAVAECVIASNDQRVAPKFRHQGFGLISQMLWRERCNSVADTANTVLLGLTHTRIYNYFGK